jgi:tetratricopeptide (TPR) repeat protein
VVVEETAMRRVVVVLAVCLLWPPDALAQPRVTGVAPAAQPHLERGLKLFEAKDYPRALESFRAAYNIDPQPALLYAIAQAERLNGDCRRAIRFYEAFLRTGPKEVQALSARQNVERCAAELRRAPPASQPASAPAVVEAPSSPPLLPLPPPPPAPRPSWRANWLGHGLVLSGVAVAAAGAALWGVGQAAITSANGAADYGTFAARRGDAAHAETLRAVGVVGVSAGAALVVAGALTYALRGRRAPERAALAPVVGPGSAALVLAGAW